MRYYVWYSTGPYDGHEFVSFETEKQVVDLLNLYASNTQFKFDVIYGSEVKFKPVDVVKAYEKA